MAKEEQLFQKQKDLIYNNKRKTAHGGFTQDTRVRRLRPRKKSF